MRLPAPAPLSGAPDAAAPAAGAPKPEPPKPPVKLSPGEQLIKAVDEGDSKEVGRLLSAGADVNSRGTPLTAFWNKVPVTDGPTALMIAMRRGHDEIANLLLDAKADPQLREQFKKTAAMIALEYSNINMTSLQRMIKGYKEADFASVDDFGHNLLHYAALAGAADVVDLILERDTNAVSVRATVADGEHSELDLLALSSKHGQGVVIERLLHSQRKGMLMDQSKHNESVGARAGSTEKKRSKGDHGITSALILACSSGNWLDELVVHVAEELDEADKNGLTPIMHALTFGQESVAKELLKRDVCVTDPVPYFDKAGNKQFKSIMMLTLETIVSKKVTDETLETIKDLVRAGAVTEIPPLDGERLGSDEILAQLSDSSHAIGYALALPARETELEQVLLKYSVVRQMLAAAFIEAPGAALCAFVALASTMRMHAERVHLSDLELSTKLEEEAQEVGSSVDKIIKSLPELEQQRLLFSIPGDNFLRFAAESGCRKMLFSPVIANHISNRWLGDYMSAVFGEGALGVYQWGGRLEIGNAIYWGLLLPLLPVVWLLNMLLLPLVALYPPFADMLRSAVDKFGEYGVDPRESPRRPEGKLGYSPTLRLWWRSLVLFDVPVFKFFTAQLGVLVLLFLLLYLAPCFDFDNHDACFGEATSFHMIGDSDFVRMVMLNLFKVDLSMFDAPEHEEEGETGRMLLADGTSIPDDENFGAVVRRALKGGGRGKTGKVTTGSSTGFYGEAYEHTIPNLFGLPKDIVYSVLLLYGAAVFMSSIHAKPSLATAHTYLSSVGAALAGGYLALDLVILYELDRNFDLQPMMLSLAAFMLWMDVCRALLLKTFTCGPYVLMLSMMFRDVAIFLIIATAIAIGFALALFFNGTLKVMGGDAATPSADCPFSAGVGFTSYGIALLEELIGMGAVGSQIDCAKSDGDVSSRVMLELYLIACTILLLNMLIAMMAETFSKVVSNQEEEYAYLNAQIVITLDLESGNVPPPISILRAPARILRVLFKSIGGKPYAALSPEASGDYKAYTHVSVDELLDGLEEADFESERADVPGLILGLKSELQNDLAEAGSIAVKVKAKKEAKVETKYDVMAYDGYSEEASRLVFHYGDRFSYLAQNPLQLTFLPSGVSENEAKPLPIRVADEAPTEKEKAKGENPTQAEMEAKLKSRGLTSYPFAQMVPEKSGRKIIEEVGDTYVYRRLNGEYGLSQIWPIKVNKQFFESFQVTNTNPNPKVFQPQAVVEFERSIEKLFGKGATRNCPIIFAQNTRKNTKPIFKGSAEALQLFLRGNPAAVEGLRIAKLFPGGFISVVSIGGNPKKNEPPKKDSFKQFDFTPGIEYVLYTKQGYESMACVKGYFQFAAECELGKRNEELELHPPPAIDTAYEA